MEQIKGNEKKKMKKFTKMDKIGYKRSKMKKKMDNGTNQKK